MNITQERLKALIAEKEVDIKFYKMMENFETKDEEPLNILKLALGARILEEALMKLKHIVLETGAEGGGFDPKLGTVVHKTLFESEIHIADQALAEFRKVTES